MSKLLEMFEDGKGALSSSRLAYMMVTVTLCWLVVHMELKDETDAGIIGILAGMGMGTYGFNKWSEGDVEKHLNRREDEDAK